MNRQWYSKTMLIKSQNNEVSECWIKVTRGKVSPMGDGNSPWIDGCQGCDIPEQCMLNSESRVGSVWATVLPLTPHTHIHTNTPRCTVM